MNALILHELSSSDRKATRSLSPTDVSTRRHPDGGLPKGHLFFLRATDGVRPWEPPRPGLEAAAVVLGQSSAPLLHGDALSPPHNGVPRRRGARTAGQRAGALMITQPLGCRRGLPPSSLWAAQICPSPSPTLVRGTEAQVRPPSSL
ncbi:hypothetical protein MRX96_005207 [Rhipicephalus microplus]